MMRKVRDFKQEDAAALAKCINESEGGWPGGVSGGLEHTAQHILDDYERMLKITWLIAVSEMGDIAGVSTLGPDFDDPKAAYLGFLNVSDVFRKKGYGKALLIESVNRVMKEGYKRLFLHTWAGNLNAVPVYKRTGFFWRPDTQVLMENYIPTILTMPITQSFFAKHNWYETFEREIKIAPDEMTHRGLRVYDLRWTADGDHLRVAIDRESREPTLIETGEVQVECWVADNEHPLGAPLAVEWSIQNKHGLNSLKGTLRVTLPEGIELIEAPPSEFVVEPSATLTLKGTIQGLISVVPPLEERPALALSSHFTLGNQSVDLETGIRFKHPIEVSTVPTSIWCRPGNQLSLEIAVKSNLKEPAQGTVFIETPKGVDITEQQFDISLKPNQYSGVSARVTVDEKLQTAPLPLKLFAELQQSNHQMTTRTETIYLHCLSAGGVLVTPFDDEKRLQVHTESLTFEINLSKGAHIDRLTNKLTRRQQIRSHFRNSLGPPFWPSEQMQTHFQHFVEQPGDGTTRIVTWMKSHRYPGLKFTKTFVLTGKSPIIQVEYDLENTHASNTYKLRLTNGSIPGIFNFLHVLPLKKGLMREESVEEAFFATNREIPKDPDEWLETWYCAERPQTGDVTAVLCHPQFLAKVEGYTFLNFQLQIPPLPPKQKVSIPPMYLYAGLGRWQHIRQLWHQLYSIQSDQPLQDLHPYRAISVQPTESPALLKIDKEIKTAIQLQHFVHRPLEGTLKITPPTGWMVTPQTYEFKGVTLKEPLTIPITLTAKQRTKPGPSVLTLQTTTRTSAQDFQATLPLFLHHKPGVVTLTTEKLENQELFVIDNGVYLLKIAPAFAGSVIGLISKTTGTNYLASSWPKAGPKVWMNPWYGGIRFEPFAPKQPGWFPTKLDKEQWKAKKIQRGDWSGISVSTRPNKFERKLKGFRLELQVLTQPFSNIVALVNRIYNSSTAPQQIHQRIRLSFPPRGHRKGLVTITPQQTTELHRRRVSSHAWPTASQHYVGIEHMKDNATAVFISKLSIRGELFIGDLGKEIIWITTEELLDVPPQVTIEHMNYLVVTHQSWKEAKAYAALANYSV